MVEWGSLLRSCLSNPWTVGSNPTLSASLIGIFLFIINELLDNKSGLVHKFAYKFRFQ